MKRREDRKLLEFSDPESYLVLTAHINLLELNANEREFVKELLQLLDDFAITQSIKPQMPDQVQGE